MFDRRCEYTGIGTCVCEWYADDWLTMLGSTGVGNTNTDFNLDS